MSRLQVKALLRVAAPALVVAAGLLITNQVSGLLRANEESRVDQSSTTEGSDSGLSDGAEGVDGARGAQNRGPDEVRDALPPDVVQMGFESDAPNDFYPTGCPLVRGVPCVVQFRGNYRLTTRSVAILRFGGFADGGKEPVCQTELYVARGAGTLMKQLTCAVPPSATKMAFKASLLDGEGKILYDPKEVPELPVR